ncbi:MAG: hypothetical protein ACXVFQ_19520 [Solirubrobacteraceae bacterium]
MRAADGRHLMLLITSAAGMLTLALLVTTPARSGGVPGGKIMPAAARISGSRGAGRSSSAAASRAAVAPATRPARSCAMATNAAGYVNPLGLATLQPKRIDQGVDYAGSGKLTALGRGTITNVATATTGWHGTYIEYELLTGRDAGCYVYYAEGVLPAAGLRVGETVRAGEPVATIIPNSSTGIEVGWAAGQGMISYAAKTGQWSPTHEQDDIPSAAGLYFSALIASLGGPPGRVEG